MYVEKFTEENFKTLRAKKLQRTVKTGILPHSEFHQIVFKITIKQLHLSFLPLCKNL